MLAISTAVPGLNPDPVPISTDSLAPAAPAGGAPLFNEFYSKIVSRDITIKNTIEGEFGRPLRKNWRPSMPKIRREITRLPVTKQGKMLARRYKKYTDDLDSLNDSKEADVEVIKANTKSLKKEKTFDKTLVKLSPNTRIDISNINDVYQTYSKLIMSSG